MAIQQTKDITKNNNNSYKYSLAAFGSSFVLGLLHPLDVIKTRLQSHDGSKINNIVPKYNSIIDAVQQIKKNEGLKGFYKGYLFSFCAASISRVLFFTLYEKSKDYYKNASFNKLQDKHVMISSLTSGVCATLITTPLWVIKTRMLLNTNHNITGKQNFKQAVNSIYKDHNIQGFWKGLSVSLPLCLHGMIQMEIYEEIIKVLNSFDKNGSSEYKSSAAGFISKISAILITYPLQTLRTRLQQKQYISEVRDDFNQRIPKYKNVYQLTKTMVQKEGLKSFYKGVQASLIMNAPSQAIYFYVYQFLKNILNVENNQLE
ncbi:Mitochondrial carrier domain [Pseudocohnilembus persalinus]|uniref:Mitochondrial carrier domain n=1 Tax=Pseudocohnilembus persalinus TaxID=266149 RepID=A0A0V0R4N7_PSEPJ|nr:Mitochondrial carrier domain [Pseudocohnilembus persalinus]|eukprot:KRX09176.1 Mitochondrial carrier domain [Pseudocohnilembus persalinus]